jgi:hypothetical protein
MAALMSQGAKENVAVEAEQLPVHAFVVVR